MPDSELPLLRAAIEAGLDGVVVVSDTGRMLSMNRRFVEMWPIPEDVVESGDDGAALASAMEKLIDPEGFIARVHELYADPTRPARDELLLRDGRVFDRWGTPLLSPAGVWLGWAWYFRDVTAERTAAQEALAAGERFARLARTLQESLLPPHLPDVPGLELAARYLPGTAGVEVGGDFYDVFQLSGTAWALTVGDVCGKGVEAATVTALARYTIRAAAVTRTSPSDVLRLLNEAMRRQHPDSDRFLTACYVTLTQAEETVRAQIGLAGHPPVLCRRANGTVEELGLEGTLLGVLDDIDLHDHTVHLSPGDTLIAYTDGLIEARRGPDQYGQHRLAAALAAASGSAAEIADSLQGDLAAFADGRRDDQALVVVRVVDQSEMPVEQVDAEAAAPEGEDRVPESRPLQRL